MMKNIFFLKNRLNKLNRSAVGLTLVELLVSLVIMAIAISVASSIVNAGLFGLKRTEEGYDIQNLIDRDLSQIESYADRYVFVGSDGSIASSTPAKDGYILANDSSSWQSFSSRCKETVIGNDIITPLIDLIDANIPAPSGLLRDLQANGSGSADAGIGRIKHLTAVYRKDDADGLVLRNSTIIPTIISYCP